MAVKTRRYYPGTCVTCGHWAPDCASGHCAKCRRIWGRIKREQGARAAREWEITQAQKAQPAMAAPAHPTDLLPGRWGKLA